MTTNWQLGLSHILILWKPFKKQQKKNNNNFILHHGQADTEVIIKKAGLTVKTCLGLL